MSDPIGFYCINSAGKNLFFTRDMIYYSSGASEPRCRDESVPYKNVGKCPGKTISLVNRGSVTLLTTSPIIMGVDPATMQWTFTQSGITRGPNIELVLGPGTYTFDYSSVAPYHVFGFTSDPCGVADVTNGITYSGNKMTVTVTPAMRSSQYWYACQIHNCMTSLTPIAFI